MTMQIRINRKGQAHIQGLQNAVKVLWKKACEEDHIPSDSKFVVFSDDNRYLPFYNQALSQLWEAQAQYRAGGYVGLQIVGGKARM